MMCRIFIGFLFFITSISSMSAELQLIWSIENQFSMPESATYDRKRKAVYVSNVNQYAKDGNGFISKVSADGKHLNIKWIEGLHSPTGMVARGDRLYAADYDALVIVDLVNEKIIKRIDAPDAEQKPSLNDVALSANGEVYVSGSNSSSIYKLVDGKLTVWQQAPEQLKYANGLLVFGTSLLHGGLHWTAYDIESKSVNTSLTEMGQGLRDIDGISQFGTKSFVVTLIDDDRLWRLEEGQAPRPLTEDEVKGIDMQYVPKENMLFIPRVGNSLSAYRIVNP